VPENSFQRRDGADRTQAAGNGYSPLSGRAVIPNPLAPTPQGAPDQVAAWVVVAASGFGVSRAPSCEILMTPARREELSRLASSSKAGPEAVRG